LEGFGVAFAEAFADASADGFLAGFLLAFGDGWSTAAVPWVGAPSPAAEAVAFAEPDSDVVAVAL
jgi:hypothetical protein